VNYEGLGKNCLELYLSYRLWVWQSISFLNNKNTKSNVPLCFLKYFYIINGLLRVAFSKLNYIVTSGVPRNVIGGGGVQQIQLRTEDREKGGLGAVAPSSGVLEAAVIWYKKFHFI